MNTNAADQGALRFEDAVEVTDALLAELREVPILATLTREQLQCLEPLQLVHAARGATIVDKGSDAQFFWIVLEGELDVLDIMPDGRESVLFTYTRGYAFGELPLLANIPSSATIRALNPSRLLRLDDNSFWRLMTICPEIRKSILHNMAYRLQKMQSRAVQQEKMAALGTLAAGLMHELNNPGTAARRAASQLRENMLRLHELTARFTRQQLTDSQKDCLLVLQEQALSSKAQHHLSSLEQSDAEEALLVWMEGEEIADAWRLAPTLAGIGISAPELACARHEFANNVLGDALSWLEALVSSVQLVGTIEESIGRVTDLVRAVKSYAYEGSGQVQKLDVNESLHATLVILGHKLREKQVVLETDLARNLPPLQSECTGLNQIWTNLLDNAIDAVKQGGHIGVRTWADQRSGAPPQICILISDDGEGIDPAVQSQVFDPFFTTKGVGVGTGMGLGIVHKLVEQYHGTIHFSSEPGHTAFVVRLPVSHT